MRYTCPKCDGWLDGIGNRMHNCPGLGDMAIYFIPEDQDVKIIVNEREDYINGETVQLDSNNRPIMSIKTVRDDGEDIVIYAPTATLDGTAHGLV